MSDFDQQVVSDFTWAGEYPVYGLGDDFTGPRWIDGTGRDSYGPNALILGHGESQVDEGPRLLVGFGGFARGVAAIHGRYEMKDSLASTLVNAANEERYLACEAYADRQRLAHHLMEQEVPKVRWTEMIFDVDGEALGFSVAELAGSWCAVRELPKAFVWMHATNWNLYPPVKLVRIPDLTPYLQSRSI